MATRTSDLSAHTRARGDAPPEDVRGRLIRATAELLARGGREAVSTRAVSAAAGVQTPAIYRQFGDMRGLLDAVAREAFAAYVGEKAARARTDDPVAELRRGWDRHVAFGLAHPAAFVLVYGDPAAAIDAPAVREGEAYLRGLVTRVAEAGRLRVDISHAVRLIAAGTRGVTLALIAAPPAARDPRLSEAMREAVLAAITVAAPGDGADGAADPPGPARVAARAVALGAVLAEAPDALSAGEAHLFSEWLDRLAGVGGRPA